MAESCRRLKRSRWDTVKDGRGGFVLESAERGPSSSGKWFYTNEEIEKLSPSRLDGIESDTESMLRTRYCAFLTELGHTLQVPQVAIARSMALCHHFYMRQSHSKNDWQIVAAVCMFHACKLQETPRSLKDFVITSYKLIHKWDPSAEKKIREPNIFDKQKKLILIGERLLLSTLAFDCSLELPYKSLIRGLKKLNITKNDLVQVAWNFVNDWMCTTLCLQYKANHIAAGSSFLAAKLLKVALPALKENPWCLQFDITRKQLEEVVHQGMIKLLGNVKKEPVTGIDQWMIEYTPSDMARSTIKQPGMSEHPVTSTHLEEAKGFPSSSHSKLPDGEGHDKWKVPMRQGSDASSSKSAIVE